MAKCPICEHPQRAEIEAHILGRTMTQGGIAKEFGMHASYVSTHRAHIANAGKEVWRPKPIVRPAVPAAAAKQETRGAKCTVCEHRKREAIETAWLLKRGTQDRIAETHGLHKDAIGRHFQNHVTEDRKKEIVLAAKEAASAQLDDEINADQVDIAHGMKRILKEIETILGRARGEDDTLALTALRDMRATLESLAKLYGQLQDKTTIVVSINEAPEWLKLRAILGDVFRDHPEAGAAFVAQAQQARLSIAGQANAI